MFRLALGAVLLVFLGVLGGGPARAQVSPPTPLTGTPKVPKTLPVIGGSPFPINGENVAVASAANDPRNVTTLIAVGNSPDDVDRHGRTGLINAALSNYARIAKTLIAHGANINLRDKLGYTALHWAAERGSIAVMRLLLAARAVVNIPNLQGITPLMLAARSGNLAAVRLLLEHHADPTKCDYTGRDAIGWAANHVAVVHLLTEASAKQ